MVLRRRWRPFIKTMLLVTLRIVLWSCLLFVPGIVAWIRYFLYAPVVLLEGLETTAAMIIVRHERVNLRRVRGAR